MIKKRTLITFIFFAFSIALFSQSQTNEKNSNTSVEKASPKAVINYKTPQKVDKFIEKINELTNGDERLTEQVVFKISQLKTTNIKVIVSDNEFNNLSVIRKKEAIRESEVIDLIQILKK